MSPKSLATACLFFVVPSTLLASDLTVNVADIRNDEGSLRIALHDGADGFPSKREPIAVQSMPARSSGVRVIFANIAPGTYAATLFHDEDDDGELDANLIGIPTEGFAFSNDAKGNFGPPKFAAAKFEMPDADLTISTTVAY